MKIDLPRGSVSGRYRCVTSTDQEMNNIVSDTGFFSNLITDAGLNRIGSVNISGSAVGSGTITPAEFHQLLGRFSIGSGNRLPVVTDTFLENRLHSQTVGNVVIEEQTSNFELGYYEITVSYQFGQGAAEGNISEIGLQPDRDTPLATRSRILDMTGNPTTVVVRDIDFLTCYFTLRVNIPKEDSVFNIVVNDDGVAVPTEVTIRAANADNPQTGGSRTVWGGWGLKTRNRYADNMQALGVYELSSETGQPAANSKQTARADRSTRIQYIHDSFEVLTSVVWEANSANFQDGIGVVVESTHIGTFQVKFDPPIMKDDTKELEIIFGRKWDRVED